MCRALSQVLYNRASHNRGEGGTLVEYLAGETRERGDVLLKNVNPRRFVTTIPREKRKRDLSVRNALY